MEDKSTELIKITEENLVTLLHSPSGLSMGKPFGKQIFLLEAHIAGTTFLKEDINKLAASINEGDRLNFFREADNPHDELAIVVKDASGKKMGYVPRTNNKILARLMDAGKLIYGILREKRIIHNWLRINMEIYLDD
jgi:hypothetical protein